MLLKKMQQEYIDDVMLIEKELFPSSTFSKENLEKELENNFAHYYILVDNNSIIGFIGMWFVYEKATIIDIGIKKSYQNKHLSLKLMDHALLKAKQYGCESVDLEVRKSNIKAINLYEKYGFEKKAIRKNYYADNHEDAYLMIKERIE